MTTLTYSTVEGLDIQLDLYLPQSPAKQLPVVIFFHPGGLTSGNRKDMFFPEILKDLSLQNNFVFISADYRLLPVASGYDILDDIKALFAFIGPSGGIASHLPPNVTLDTSRTAVIGTSAGAYVALLAAVHGSPQPKAVLLGYGLGGDLISDRFLAFGDDLFPPFAKEEWISGRLKEDTVHPKHRSDLPMYVGDDGQLKDSLQAWLLAAWFQQNGTFLDYITGQHGLSEELKKLPKDKWVSKVAEHGHKDLFPELLISKLPPTFLFHGDKDITTSPRGSKRVYEDLKRVGTKTEYVVVEGADHVLWAPGTMEPIQPVSDEVHTRGFQFIAAEI